jgi:hypothetical protein
MNTHETATTMVSYESTPRGEHQKIDLSNSKGFFVSQKQVIQKDDMILSVQVSKNPSRVSSNQVSQRENKMDTKESTQGNNKHFSIEK